MIKKNKDAFYFSHDSNARNDDKIIAVRMKHDWKGYGLFWAVIEKMREANNYKCVRDYNVIAYDLRTDASTIKSIVEDFGLFVFTEDGKHFYSERLINSMDIKDCKSLKAKESADKRWELERSKNQNDANALPTHTDSNAIKDKLSKEKEIKDNLKKEKEIIQKQESVSNFSNPPVPALNVDFKKLIVFFNENRGNMPQVQNFSKTRQQRISNLIKNYSKEKLMDVILNCRNSNFIQGINDRGWVADFDWITQPKNFIKILEGNYKNKENGSKRNNPQATDTEHKQSAVIAVNAMFGIK